MSTKSILTSYILMTTMSPAGNQSLNTSRQPVPPTQSSWGPGIIISLVFGVVLSSLTVLAILLAHKYHRAHRHSMHCLCSLVMFLYSYKLASIEETPNTSISEGFELQGIGRATHRASRPTIHCCGTDDA